MSQRNPMNERYNNDEGMKGQTRKSAASAKPKAKAAASVYIEPKEKTPQQKRAEAKARRKKEREEARRKESDASTASAQKAKADKKAGKKPEKNPYKLSDKPYAVPTERYKKLRHMWVGCIAGGIAATAASWFTQSYANGAFMWTLIIIAYVCIIGAFYIDFGLIRKERKNYYAMVDHNKSKAARAAQKKAHAAEIAARKATDDAPAEPEPVKKGLFGRSKAKAVAGANEVAEKQAESGSLTPKE